MRSISLGTAAFYTFLTLTVSLLPIEFLKVKTGMPVFGQPQNISQADILADLNKLELAKKNSGSSYNIGLSYLGLATLAEKFGFQSEKEIALLGAEKSLGDILDNTSIFSFKTTSSQSTMRNTNSGLGWRSKSTWTSDATSCEVIFKPDYGLLNSTSRLLQRVYIAQNKPETALLVSEFGRTIAIDKIIASFYFRESLNLCYLAKNLAPRLAIEDLKQIAIKEKAKIVSYSIISYQDDLSLVLGIRSARNGNLTRGNFETPSDLYIWVIQPETGRISFVKQPLSSLNLESFGCKADAVDCRPGELSGLIGAIAEVRGGSPIDKPNSSFSPISKQISDQNKQLNQLYKLLIKPIEHLLPSNPNARIIFVPQGSLNFVPFAALKDSEDSSGKYLIEKHTIMTAPNMRSLLLSRRNRDQLADGNGDALVVGNPKMPQTLSRQLSQLPFAETEAREISQLLKERGFGIDEPLIGANANKVSVTNRMRNTRIIHLATHGILDDQSNHALIDYSKLLTPGKNWDDFNKFITSVVNDRTGVRKFRVALVDKDAFNKIMTSLNQSTGVDKAAGSIILASLDNTDGILNANEIAKMDLKKAELIVLSACNTGRGNLTPGGIIGLPFTLSMAGVSSMIVSLWSVPDKSTSQLMTSFYRNLLDSQKNPKRDKAIALRRAMLEMLQKNPNISPSEWAAFTLVGVAD